MTEFEEQPETRRRSDYTELQRVGLEVYGIGSCVKQMRFQAA